jgi:hypothetical protein
VLFSDSVLLVSKDDSLGSVEYLLWGVQSVVSNALLNGIPIKGAIAHGEQTASFIKSLYVGRPLIDAWELQNELVLYGVILHHTMERYLTDTGFMNELKGVRVFRYSAPMKQGPVNHYLVDWAGLPDVDRKIEALLSRLYCNVSGFSRRYVDNTVDFVHWLKKARYEAAKIRGRSSGMPITHKDMEKAKQKGIKK